MEFARESYDQVIDEIKELVQKHYDEAGIFDFKFAPQFEIYKQVELANILHIFTARKDGKLIGYVVSFVTKHIHYEHVDVAMVDLVFVHPDYRKGWTAMLMMEAWTEDLKTLQVNMACVPTRNKGLIDVLGKTGYEPMDTIMIRKL